MCALHPRIEGRGFSAHLIKNLDYQLKVADSFNIIHIIKQLSGFRLTSLYKNSP